MDQQKIPKVLAKLKNVLKSILLTSLSICKIMENLGTSGTIKGFDSKIKIH